MSDGMQLLALAGALLAVAQLIANVSGHRRSTASAAAPAPRPLTPADAPRDWSWAAPTPADTRPVATAQAAGR